MSAGKQELKRFARTDIEGVPVDGSRDGVTVVVLPLLVTDATFCADATSPGPIAEAGVASSTTASAATPHIKEERTVMRERCCIAVNS
jgi:hypothetical protein